MFKRSKQLQSGNGEKLAGMDDAMDKNADTDLRLVTALQENDEKAWTYLYETYSGHIGAAIKKVVKNACITEDVIQLTYMKLWSVIKQFDPSKGSLSAWITVVAKNQAIDVTRSRNYKKAKITTSLMEGDEEAASLKVTTVNISLIDVWDHLKILEPPEAMLVRMIYYNGHTQEEAAKAMAMPLGTVKSKLRRAMKRLRKLHAYQG